MRSSSSPRVFEIRKFGKTSFGSATISSAALTSSSPPSMTMDSDQRESSFGVLATASTGAEIVDISGTASTLVSSVSCSILTISSIFTWEVNHFSSSATERLSEIALSATTGSTTTSLASPEDACLSFIREIRGLILDVFSTRGTEGLMIVASGALLW